MLEFLSFDVLDSTQRFLIQYLHRSIEPKLPICVLADRQTCGIGSRDNEWESVESGLTFSFAIDTKVLPKDLPIQSFSLYLGFLLKEYINQDQYGVWIKWPNDLYIKNLKVGGVMSQCLRGIVVSGVGINLNSSSFGSLQVLWTKEEKQDFVIQFLNFFMTFPMWKEIFSKYKLEFYKNFNFTFHDGNEIIALKDVQLCDDGSVLSGYKRFYSLR